MKTTIAWLAWIALLQLYFLPAVVANQQNDWCGPLIERTWKVKLNANQELKHHLYDKVTVKKTGVVKQGDPGAGTADIGKGKFSLRIKEKGLLGLGKTHKSVEDFWLTCNASPTSAVMEGKIKIHDCVHKFRISLPHAGNYKRVSLAFPEDSAGNCKDHESDGNDHKAERPFADNIVRTQHLGRAHGEH